MLETILTIVFGIVGVVALIIAIRARRYPYKLDFYISDLGRIISTKAKKYNTIKLLHNEEEIKNAYYLKCLLVCTGEDVELPDDTTCGLQVVLPQKFKWLEVHAQESAKGLDATLRINEASPNILHISSALVKREEIYSFEAYICGEEEIYVSAEDIMIKHRLKDLGELCMREINLQNIVEAKHELKSKGIAYAMIILFLGALLVNTLFCRSVRFVEKDNTEKIHTAMLVKDDTIAVSMHHSALFPWDRKEYSINSFKEEFDLESRVPKYNKEGEQAIVIAYIIVVISYFALFGMSVAEYLCRKRLCNAIEKARNG